MTIIRGLHTFPMYSYYYWQVCDVTSIGYVAVYCLLCASIEYLFVSQSDADYKSWLCFHHPFISKCLLLESYKFQFDKKL